MNDKTQRPLLNIQVAWIFPDDRFKIPGAKPLLFKREASAAVPTPSPNLLKKCLRVIIS